MKIYSWNVNGIRAIYKKGFINWFLQEQPDILCLQETKASLEQLDPEIVNIPGYLSYWNSGRRKGYSGVATYVKQAECEVQTGIGIERFDNEGRILISKHDEFTLLNVYFPNGKMGEDRVKYKLEFYEALIDYCDGLVKRGESLIICGDFNTAHQEIDLKHPRANENKSGFLPVEREMLDKFLSHGYIDVFRHLYPNTIEYTWWSYRSRARERNAGWRIDCFYVSSDFLPFVKDCRHLTQVEGSDHCPIALTLR